MKKVMLVDDCEMLRECFKECLEEQGYTVTEAQDGEDALAKIAEENFDYIVSDWQMPVMDGVKFLETIRLKNINIPAVLWSANAAMIDLSRVADDIIVLDKGPIVESTNKLIEIMGKSIH